jgi:SnoaL-like domain
MVPSSGMATTTAPALEVGRRFLDALSVMDFDRIGSLFADDAKLQALVPAGLREEQGPEGIVSRFSLWWSDLGDPGLVASEPEPFHDLVRIRYTVTGVDPEDGAVEAEQQAYLAVTDGKIAAMNLVCSGFVPT